MAIIANDYIGTKDMAKLCNLVKKLLNAIPMLIGPSF